MAIRRQRGPKISEMTSVKAKIIPCLRRVRDEFHLPMFCHAARQQGLNVHNVDDVLEATAKRNVSEPAI